MQEPAFDPSAASVQRTVRAVFGLTLLGTLAWLAAIVLAPFLKSRSSGAAPFLYLFFSPVCHQIPERSFSLRGFPLAVCGRCLGIYAGFLAGLVLYPFVRGFQRIALPAGRIFALVSLPVGLDFLLGLLGIWDSPIGGRFATGFVWGTLTPFYFITGISDLLLRRAARRGAESPRPGGDGLPLDNPGPKTVK